jgi:UDP-N-acetylglucosamine:LPS N-acetylglucosamine transferase
MKDEFHSYSNIAVFDFVSQQEIGLLLKNCDIALTRAGTTSLAEQRLYDLKIVMVPIPRTHDQYDNAKFYVKKYKDILLDSKKDNYMQTMLGIFTKYQNFKKINTKKDILSEISLAKDTILGAILN